MEIVKGEGAFRYITHILGNECVWQQQRDLSGGNAQDGGSAQERPALNAGGPCPMRPKTRGETGKLSRMDRILAMNSYVPN
jgi:hypothetical protein